MYLGQWGGSCFESGAMGTYQELLAFCSGIDLLSPPSVTSVSLPTCRQGASRQNVEPIIFECRMREGFWWLV